MLQAHATTPAALADISRAACDLYYAGLGYTLTRTDGIVDYPMVDRLVTGVRADAPALEELVGAGLWVASPWGYQVTDLSRSLRRVRR